MGRTIGVGIFILLTAVTGCNPNGSGTIELVNVSYDPTRELYREINTAFSADYKAKTGKDVKVSQSHGGSGAQARAVIDGLDADVVTLALASDIDAIADKGKIAKDWQKRLPSESSPYTSTVAFVVRAGNPKGIKDWPDLIRPDVAVITPNPKTSGGARWNFLAAWGYVTLHKKGTEAEAEEFVRKLYQNVPKLDTGARGSTETFTRRKLGDVAIVWENEAFLIQKDSPDEKYEVIYPSVSILAEPPVALVDSIVEKRKTREEAEAYLRFLYTPAAQAIIGKHGYRPGSQEDLKKYAPTLPEIKLITIRDVAGDWSAAQTKFFSTGGVFDRTYQPK